MFFRASLIAGLISSSGGETETVRVRQPTDKWVAEYADDMCLLQRSYGTAQEPLILAFKPEPMSDRVTTYVFEWGPKFKVGWVTAELRIGDAAPPMEKHTATYYAPRLKSRVTELSLTREELNRAAVSELISIDVAKWLNAAFQVTGLSSALPVLDDCVADLLATWGFSREQQSAMAKLPELEKPFISYVGAMDYPTAALRNEETGWNSARFRIDTKGSISDCQIVESSGSRSLDATICRVARRFRYRPAINQSGQPMESLGFVRIRWQIA